ncbi:MAG TPA: 50S ribosomal protein L32 [Acidimicrobiia bacterium]|jgi:large subunit ribosomal protein L32|nr:50S ribosomal protein L32 [Acidimicrobiia bacterium]
MAVPKKKSSRMRTHHRRSAWKVSKPATSVCPQCRAQKLPHRACPTCGSYRGREVLETE